MRIVNRRLIQATVLSLCALCGAAIASSGSSPPEQGQKTAEQKNKPRIRILATGGTIAGAQAKPGEYGYKSGAFTVQDLISAVPNLDKLAVISGEQFFNIGSQDMNDEVWLKLANRLNAALVSPDVDG